MQRAAVLKALNGLHRGRLPPAVLAEHLQRLDHIAGLHIVHVGHEEVGQRVVQVGHRAEHGFVHLPQPQQLVKLVTKGLGSVVELANVIPNRRRYQLARQRAVALHPGGLGHHGVWHPHKAALADVPGKRLKLLRRHNPLTRHASRLQRMGIGHPGEVFGHLDVMRELRDGHGHRILCLIELPHLLALSRGEVPPNHQLPSLRSAHLPGRCIAHPAVVLGRHSLPAWQPMALEHPGAGFVHLVQANQRLPWGHRGRIAGLVHHHPVRLNARLHAPVLEAVRHDAQRLAPSGTLGGSSKFVLGIVTVQVGILVFVIHLLAQQPQVHGLLPHVDQLLFDALQQGHRIGR